MPHPNSWIVRTISPKFGPPRERPASAVETLLLLPSLAADRRAALCPAATRLGETTPSRHTGNWGEDRSPWGTKYATMGVSLKGWRRVERPLVDGDLLPEGTGHRSLYECFLTPSGRHAARCGTRLGEAAEAERLLAKGVNTRSIRGNSQGVYRPRALPPAGQRPARTKGGKHGVANDEGHHHPHRGGAAHH